MHLRFLLASVFVMVFSTVAHAIVRGTPVASGSGFAHSTVLILFGDQNRCTGVIVHPRLVLTAGHCNAAPADDFRIAYTTDLTPALQGREKVVVGRVLQVIPNPREHEVDALSDDLALFVLREPVPAPYVPAALPLVPFTSLVDETVTALGYGLQNAEGMLKPMVPANADADWEPVRLEQKDFVVSQPAQTDVGGIQLSYDRLFVEQAGGGICQGDSGGPVFLKSANDRPLLVAVNGATVPVFAPAPARPPCAANAYVTRVDTALPWIREVAAAVSAMSGK